jgi:hypothetical protein
MRHLSAVSAAAVLSAFAAGSGTAQTSLPAINVGGQRIVHSHPVVRTHAHAHTHVTPAGPVTHTHPVAHTHFAPALRPAVAAQTAPAPQPAPPAVTYPPAPPITSSSEKYFTGKEVNAIPFARPGEALEIVPGLVVTQHSGEGKANQYFLRGFNLDHGSDLGLYLDGTPLNMRTNGHAQGYADANFLIPELLSSALARKGPYSAEDGDFSTAGSVYLQYLDRFDKGLFSATGGQFGYGRLLGIKSWNHAGGTLLGAAEASIYNGPWDRPDSIRKINGVLRWTRGTQEDGLSITGMAYANRWYSTDQLPMRAVSSGLVRRWGTMDPTDGGDTSRFSLSGRWSQKSGNQYSRVEAYAVRSTLNLYNNFTYFLSHPDIGDQFRQFDRRTMVGVNALHGIAHNVADFPIETRAGFQGRYDDIRLGLQESYRRTPYDTIRNDYVNEGSIGIWTDTKVSWTPWLRTIGGVRFDYFHARVQGLQQFYDSPLLMNSAGQPAVLWTAPFNSGTKANAMVSPKASIILGPFHKTEFYANYGEGFHSTDARGTVQNFSTTELADDDGFRQVARIPILVKSRGAEIGARTKIVEGLDSSLSFFWVNVESENQFEGDSGTTAFGRPSRRYGLEFANHYRPTSWLSFDGDVALVHARFRGVDQQQALAWVGLLQPGIIEYGAYLGNMHGNYLTNSAAVVAMAGLEVGEQTGWFGAMKYRYIGPRPLTEDGYIKSPATGTVNARVGYRWQDGWKVQLDAFNIFASRSDQITYGYGSMLPTDQLHAACLAGAPGGDVCGVGVMDRHFKPVEPPSFRLTLAGPLSYDTGFKLPDVTEPFNGKPPS